jgi:hypothetical protein
MEQQKPPPYQGSDPVNVYQPAPTNMTATNVNVVHTATPTVVPKWGEYPVSNYRCPYCGNTITTVTQSKMGNTAILLMVILFLFIGVFALFILCIDSFNDVEHVCPVDGRVVGVYKRM